VWNKGRSREGGNILNMADMGPRQGFASALSGCRIRRRETDCRRIGWMAVEEPLGGMVVFVFGFGLRVGG
jgi:hypothetical protein